MPSFYLPGPGPTGPNIAALPKKPGKLKCPACGRTFNKPALRDRPRQCPFCGQPIQKKADHHAG